MPEEGRPDPAAADAARLGARNGRAELPAASGEPAAVALAPAEPPSSVYRFQLSAKFPFARARERLAYLRELGVDSVYLSPIFQAAPGSEHGYDVTDPNAISADLGGAAAFDELAAEAARLGLKLLLDWVPNHMGVADNNALWADVLENGRASRFARFFDIDWFPAKRELAGKVLLPVLPDLYGRVLEEIGRAHV
jgi:(1->4)-alpha-D-glucan 1-alpha-D-glucosylmutase